MNDHYSNIPQEIQEKLLFLHLNDGSKSQYALLVLKNKTIAPNFYDLERPFEVNSLFADYKREYLPEQYQAEVEAQQKRCDAGRELKKFNAAKVIESKDYDEFVFYDGQWYYDVDSFIEHYISEYDDDNFIAAQHLPKYLWGSKPVELTIPDINSVLELIYGESHEWEDSPADDTIGLEKLKTALEKFVDINKNHGFFEEDNKTAVLLTEDDFAWADKRWAESNEE